jgi:hypothetical protein
MSAFSNDEMAMVDDDALNHALATGPESPPGWADNLCHSPI